MLNVADRISKFDCSAAVPSRAYTWTGIEMELVSCYCTASTYM